MLGASACVRSMRLFTFCEIESTAHPEEACNLKPTFMNEVKCFHDNDWNGQPLPTVNPFLQTTINKLITLDTHGACISCVLFRNL